ncbi:SulP family inorganic anion transporter [Aeromicrobium sp.]|uniref:SulP family inorganic anion transporter n=1 Tax=Aeromicrobium sp. TaxID=1871063 RepID=UPI0025BE53BE|nr:SulP family inorganic anion transporter [Aeromicrobium sp.]
MNLNRPRASSAAAFLLAARTRTIDLLPRRADVAAAGRDPRRDLLAGLTVAIVALPLALAFGVASGLGAQAGLATAVVAGIVAAVFGGSNLQVSGPTGAMTVVLVPVVHQYGVSAVLMVGFMAGLVLVVMAVAKLGRWVRFLPVSVIEGFTAGIAVVIALQQVPSALGVSDASGDRVWAGAVDAVVRYVQHPSIASPLAALAVVAVMLIGARWRPGVPFSLLGIAAVTLLAQVADLGLTPLGNLPGSLPAPSLGFIDVGAVGALMTSALAIAALAALESLLCATVADGMSANEQHDPDRELFGQGLANVAASVFGGVPATAAIARTAVNVRAGARSRMAAITHSLVLLVVIFAAAPLVSKIPLAALAGVLFATCIRMVEAGSIRTLMRSSRSDALIVGLTFTVTVAIDLVTAVGVGVAVAVLLALRSVARTARIDKVPLEVGDYAVEEHELLSEHIVAYRLDGPLFFAAAHRLLLELPEIANVKVVILRMSRVTTMDSTGARLLGDAITKLEHRGIIVLLSGIVPHHDGVLASLGIGDKLRSEGRVFGETPSAIAHARELLGANHLTSLASRRASSGEPSINGRALFIPDLKDNDRLTRGLVQGEQARELLARSLRRHGD